MAEVQDHRHADPERLAVPLVDLGAERARRREGRNEVVLVTIPPEESTAVAVTVYSCAGCSAQVLRQVARVCPVSAVSVPPTVAPCVLTWTLRIRLAPRAVTMMGACGLTPDLPPAGEMAGGTLLACGFAARPAVRPPPAEQAAMTRHAPAAPASQAARPRYGPMIPRIPRTLSLT
jgi:hypothetical protein